MEFKASLGYKMRPSLKNKIIKQNGSPLPSSPLILLVQLFSTVSTAYVSTVAGCIFRFDDGGHFAQSSECLLYPLPDP